MAYAGRTGLSTQPVFLRIKARVESRPQYAIVSWLWKDADITISSNELRLHDRQ